jgi:DNA-binding LytR/AlgR family response regulator
VVELCNAVDSALQVIEKHAPGLAFLDIENA